MVDDTCQKSSGLAQQEMVTVSGDDVSSFGSITLCWMSMGNDGRVKISAWVSHCN